MHRILYLSHDGPMGGSARQLLLLLSTLDRRRYEPVVACHLAATAAELRGAGIEAHVLPLPLPGWWTSAPRPHAQQLARLAGGLGAGLVHANKLELGRYLAETARQLGVPSVVHVRTPLLPVVRWRAWARRAELPFRLARLGCNDASAVLAISPRIRRQLLLGGTDERRIELVGDAVDATRFVPDAADRNVLRAEHPHARELLVGLVGRIEPVKRQLALVEAARGIVGTGRRDVTFFLIGRTGAPGYHRRVVERIRRYGLEGQVMLTGGRDDMPRVLRSLDVLVSLSGGSVTFEAMASGVAVLSAGFSTADSAVHLQDGRTGLLVASRGIPELVEALRRLLDDAQLRRQLGAQARAWAEAHLGHEAMTEKIQTVYDRLLARAPR